MCNAGKRHIYIIVCILFTLFYCLTGCNSVDEVIDDSSAAADSMETELSSESSPSQDLSEASEYFITPNEDLPVVDIPQPESPPQISNDQILGELNANQEYESGKITLSLDRIDGDPVVVVIADDTEKEIVLDYVNSMQESTYNAMNTPPGAGGNLITVAVYRNDVIEQYLFTDMTAEGNSLGKNFQDSDVTKWTIIDKDAFSYLFDFFSS